MSTVRIQLRRGLEQDWLDADAVGLGVVLAPGEAGIETDTNKMKIGNGDDNWGALPYFGTSSNGNTLDDYILSSAKGNPSGVASLDSNGLIPSAQLPSSVKISVSSVANQAARLALTAEVGDIAIQTDSGASYVLQTTGASTDANWKELVGNEKVQDVIGAMLSGNTETGITVTYEDSDGTIDFVVADQFSTHSTSDLSEGTNLYFTDARAVTALSSELSNIDIELGNINNDLDLKATLDSPDFTGIPTADTAAPGTNNLQIATTAYTDAAIAALVDTAPGALNTLNEIAAAINDDATFSGTIVGLVSTLETDFLGHSGSPSAHGTTGDVVGTQSTQTLSNKTISGTNNTFSFIPQTAITDLGTTLGSLAPKDSPTFTGTVTGITKDMVDLSNVDNTSDANKPVSTSTQNALDLKADITDLDVLATKDSPTFTGTVILPATTSIGNTTALEIAKLHDVTATAAELNILDGVTATAAELNVLDGILASTSELNILDGVTALSSEINVLDGIISTTAELNILNGVTATAAELNTLDGVLATAAEINHLSGVTSAIQTQLNNKANSADITEAAQDAVGDVIGKGLVYDDTTGKIEPSLEIAGGLKFATTTNKLSADLDYIVDKTGIQTLTNKTLTSPKINEDVAVTATATELNYVDGVTSAIQTQLNAKAPLDSPTFTTQVKLPSSVEGPNASTSVNLFFGSGAANLTLGGGQTTGNLTIGGGAGRTTGVIGIGTGATSSGTKTINVGTGSTGGTTAITIGSENGATSNITLNGNITLPSTTSIGDVSSTELSYVNGVTSAIQTQLDGKQATVLNVSDVEIGYLDGVTSSIQTQLDAKSTDSKTETLTNKTLTSPVINTPTGITKSDVGLGNVDNTADSNKPVSTATQTALDGKENILTSAEMTNKVITGVSGSSYGLVGTSEYLDVKDTNGYNKEIELDIAAVEAKLETDGFAKLASPTFTGTVTLPGDPSSSLQAATKQYVDNTASGIVAKPQVLGATTANIDATYNNGTAGVGATLTHNTNGAFPAAAGGASGWALYKGILVKNQTNKAQNGRYYVSDMGSVSTPYVLTRCTYCDEASEIPGAYIFVQDGTSAGTGWIQVVADPTTFVVGTDNIDVFQFSGAGTITAGNGISVSGNEVSINTSITQTRVANVTDTEIGYLDGVTSSLQTQLNTKEVRYYTFITDATTARTITSSTDEGSTLKFTSSSAITITIPTAANDAGWEVGDYVEILQYGSGQITVAGDTGVTVNATDSQKKTRVQFSSLTLIKVAANEWLLTGDTAA